MTCPGNPPPPEGHRIWRGPVPAMLVQWAVDLRDHIRPWPYGTTWELEYSGRTIVARKDHHTWTYHNGELVQGLCIPGITLYEPQKPPTVSGLGASNSLDTPDPNAAVFPAEERIDWGLVGWSGAAILVAVGLFAAALEYGGKAKS